MKRSEMVDLVRDTFDELSYIEVDNLISILEEAGMLPPPVTTDVINHRLVYCYYPDHSLVENSDYELDIDKSNMWERE